jgi:hypothetical protein
MVQGWRGTLCDAGGHAFPRVCIGKHAAQIIRPGAARRCRTGRAESRFASVIIVAMTAAGAREDLDGRLGRFAWTKLDSCEPATGQVHSLRS